MANLLASIARTTAESFYRDVYKPRIALCILLVVLLGTLKTKDAHHHEHRLPVLDYLNSVDVFASLLSLHCLWLIRLLAMVVEDSIIKNEIYPSLLPDAPSAALPVLAALALSSFVFATQAWAQAAGVFLGLAKPPPLPVSLIRMLRLINMLELSATLLTLLSPLARLDHPIMERFFPKHISIPSPSHSPCLIDYLPLPSGLAEVLRNHNPYSLSPRSSRTRAAGRRGHMHRRSGTERTGGGTVPSNGAPNGASRESRTLHSNGTPGEDLTLHSNISRPEETGVSSSEAQTTEMGAPSSTPRTWVTPQAEEPLLAAPIPSRGPPRPTGYGPGLHDPLRLDNVMSLGKLLRREGVFVQVDTLWILEHSVALWNHFVAFTVYSVLAVSGLPSRTREKSLSFFSGVHAYHFAHIASIAHLSLIASFRAGRAGIHVDISQALCGMPRVRTKALVQPQ